MASTTGTAIARGVLPRIARPLMVLTGAVTAMAVVGTLDPNDAGHYPTCPFRWLTGRYCPGCGTLRAVHALVHGDVVAAVGLNALTMATLPLLAYLWLRWTAAAVRGDTGPRPLAHRYLVRALAVVVIAFGVLRNTPWGAVLAP